MKAGAKSHEHLLACPFCGGPGSTRQPFGGLRNWEVRCLSCGAATAVTHEDKPARCVQLWNARKNHLQ